MGRPWTEAELQMLRELYPSRPSAEVARRLGRSLRAVYCAAKIWQIRKSAEFLAGPESGILRKGQTRAAGVPHQFQKGHVPTNKGVRRPGWAPGRMAETQFKRGERLGAAARNWKPVGTILMDADGYMRIKVREANYQEATGFGNSAVWPHYHRHVWEQAYGPVPAGHVVCFRDGNRSNCQLDNLELISRGELAARNHWKRLPKDLQECIALGTAIKRRITIDAKKQNQRSA